MADDNDDDDKTDYRTLNIQNIYNALHEIEQVLPDSQMNAFKILIEFCTFSLALMDTTTEAQANIAAANALRVYAALQEKKILH